MVFSLLLIGEKKGIITYKIRIRTYEVKKREEMLMGSRAIPVVEKELLRRVHGGVLLDLGFGRGDAMKRFMRYGGWSALGLDPSIERLKDALSYGDVVRGSGEHLPFKDSTFDVVLSINVLHHILNPLKVLGEINRVLKKAGYLLLVESTEDNPFLKIARLLIPSYEGDPVLSRFKERELRSSIMKYFQICCKSSDEFLWFIVAELLKRLRISNFPGVRMVRRFIKFLDASKYTKKYHAHHFYLAEKRSILLRGECLT